MWYVNVGVVYGPLVLPYGQGRISPRSVAQCALAMGHLEITLHHFKSCTILLGALYQCPLLSLSCCQDTTLHPSKGSHIGLPVDKPSVPTECVTKQSTVLRLPKHIVVDQTESCVYTCMSHHVTVM